MKVRDLMTTDVKNCRKYSTLNTAAQTMWVTTSAACRSWITRIALSAC